MKKIMRADLELSISELFFLKIYIVYVMIFKKMHIARPSVPFDYFSLVLIPKRPIKPELNNQTALGMGTGFASITNTGN